MRGIQNRVAGLAARIGAGLASGMAFAGAATAAPNGPPGQMNLSTPYSNKMVEIVWFHNYLLILITAICIFVAGLLVYTCWRFAAKRNPIPSRLTHHTGLEVAWTIIPVLILVVIAIPSFRIMRDQLVIPPSDVTLKITGKQWLWTWEYPRDAGGFSFDQIMLDDKQRMDLVNSGKAKPADVPRLLAVDNEAVIPAGKIIRLQVTAADVIHKFALPSFGLKLDAIPGRLNELWFRADKEGVFYGQCSHVCGENHAFMPIAIRVVSPERYAAWIEESKKNPNFQQASDRNPRVAAAAP